MRTMWKRALLSLPMVLALVLLPGAAFAEGWEEIPPAEAPEAESASGAALSGTWEGRGEFWDGDAYQKEGGVWSLDEAGTLSIEGQGRLPYYGNEPWAEYQDAVRRLVVGSGITEVYYFNGYKRLSEAVLLDTVVSIGERAFQGCTALTDITLGAGLTEIGASAFEGTCLESLTLPAGLTWIGAKAFAECDQLDVIAVAAGNAAFRAVDGVVFSADGKTLVLYPSGRRGPYEVPAGVETVADGAFSGARGLTAITFPAGTLEVGASAFSGCDALTGLTLPKGLRVIGERAFSGCDVLVEITLPEGLETIGASAFSSCGRLTGLDFPEGLRTIGDSAFSSCRALTRAQLPEGLEAVGEYAFVSCSGLKTVSLPGTLQSLGSHAFQFCYGMTDLTLGEGISRIENRAFDGCFRIQRLMLPKSLTYIGSDVFTSAEQADIHFAGTESEWETVRLGYNALPEGLRVRCGSAGPVEPDLDGAQRSGWPSYDWEHESTVWDLSLTIDNGGTAGDVAVRAALYDKDGRFLGLQQRTLTLEEGEKTYDLGTLAFPGVDRGTVDSSRVFLTDASASPLYRAL